MTDTERLITKAKLVGKLDNIPTFCGIYCKLISLNDKEHIIYIPDNVTVLNGAYRLIFTDIIAKMRGTIKIIGGKGLKNINYMFMTLSLEKLDLSEFKPINAHSMDNTFAYCKIDNLILDGFDTSNISEAFGTFSNIQIKKLDLSVLNLEKLTGLDLTFEDSTIENLNMHGLKLYNLKGMNGTFRSSQIKNVDLSNIEMKDLNSLKSTFEDCKIENLDLNGFYGKEIIEVKNLFKNAKITEVDLRNFNAEQLVKSKASFFGLKSNRIILGESDIIKLDIGDFGNYPFSVCKIDEIICHRSLNKTKELFNGYYGKIIYYD